MAHELRPCKGGCGAVVAPFRGLDGDLIWLCQTCVQEILAALRDEDEPLDKEEDDA